MRCDFHVHSNHSDGELSPAEVSQQAVLEGVGLIALTDHDDVSGVAPARARGKELGLEVLPGVELSVTEQDGQRQMHILGLCIDPDEPSLLERLGRLKAGRLERAERIVERLHACGVELSLGSVQASSPSGLVSRPHVAQALVEAGVCRDQDEAFGRFLRRGRPAFVPAPDHSAQEAIDVIHQSGGIAVLAHPPLSVGVDSSGGLESFVEPLVEAGLDGLEVWHPSHTPKRRKRIRQIARRHDLVETGGSDFHGSHRPGIRIGHGRGNLAIDESVLSSIEARRARRCGEESPNKAGA